MNPVTRRLRIFLLVLLALHGVVLVRVFALQIIDGGVALRSQLPVHARNLHTLTGFLLNVFPEDSDFGETRAKEEIWEDFDVFSEAARRVQTAAGELAAVAESGSQEELQGKLGAVVDACKGCHKKYRASEP